MDAEKIHGRLLVMFLFFWRKNKGIPLNVEIMPLLKIFLSTALSNSTLERSFVCIYVRVIWICCPVIIIVCMSPKSEIFLCSFAVYPMFLVYECWMSANIQWTKLWNMIELGYVAHIERNCFQPIYIHNIALPIIDGLKIFSYRCYM